MILIQLAALLTFGSASAQTAPAPPVVAVQPSPDSAEERTKLRSLSTCLADARPNWARGTLAHPYLSTAQARAAGAALTGRDTCAGTSFETELTFRTSGLVGSLAEHFLKADIGRANFPRVAQLLNTMRPLNASEDFALCVVVRDPAAARDLALSEPGSAVEQRSAGALAAHLGGCFNPGEPTDVDLQSLRALVSVALYRGVHMALAAAD